MKRLILLLALFPAVAFGQTTANMSLVKPTVGVTVGPTWAQMINDEMDLIDSHDHTPGHGVRVPSAGMNINSTLDFQNNTETNVGMCQLSALVAANAGSPQAGSLQNVNGNLNWINGSGVAVPMTSGSSVAASVTNAFSTQTPISYPYTVSAADAQKMLLISTASVRTVNLPVATTVVYFFVKDATGSSSTNNISVVPNGTNTIDGVNATKALASNFGTWMFVSDGVSNWSIAALNLYPTPAGAPSNGQIPIGNGSAYLAATLTGTANQVSVTNGSGSVTLSLPQSIHTGATPTFASVIGTNLITNATVETNSSKQLVSNSDATFRSNHSIAQSGANSDITALNGIAFNTFSPTVFGSGSMTISSFAINEANYFKMGPATFVELSAAFTTAGTAAQLVSMNMPTTPTADSNFAAFHAAGTDGGGAPIPDLRWRSDGSRLVFFKGDGSNWSIGASAMINLKGWYH